MTVDIRTIRDRLPREVADLESEARREGHLHIARLIDQWSAGDIRFEGDGERLLGAYAGEALAGVGGVTVEPALSGALRMRRFYVSPEMRGHGIGRLLALNLLNHARDFCSVVTVHPGNPGAVKFWGALGFQPCGPDGDTHCLEIARISAGRDISGASFTL
ncbi:MULTISPECIES: GNAT family N-acetyltransferase [unclassified Rhizobium]|uniref:GNAT family N-acetyltransferase n=1 Tax=unclassified Rhizobium TaxID=2613769 RepID=UPI0007E982B9|nr:MULTISPECIES: GNAT family N-acetyltransferase [unclassified Rhizobium]ANM12565.1 GCN5-related N-acetyltransferase protein [Rhizobium sp. N324]ANM18968.1 GCN5-related N-acetyltransferase protein [Rhizobium sp. N541]ANM25353.1 GCN5-related N-acetyltransferase protein [Rhizobium sp. N941]OYD01740.1 GCN5-related N-acetyltransferase protein [Rhizobium sp. N4311]